MIRGISYERMFGLKNTELTSAIDAYDHEWVGRLIDGGMKINEQDAAGHTMLWYAYRAFCFKHSLNAETAEKSIGAIKFLLSRGAKVEKLKYSLSKVSV